MVIFAPPFSLVIGGPCADVPTRQDSTSVFGSVTRPGRISNSQSVPGRSALGIKNFREAAFGGTDATAGILYV